MSDDAAEKLTVDCACGEYRLPFGGAWNMAGRFHRQTNCGPAPAAAVPVADAEVIDGYLTQILYEYAQIGNMDISTEEAISRIRALFEKPR